MSEHLQYGSVTYNPVW